jgi:hypothetical protein
MGTPRVSTGPRVERQSKTAAFLDLDAIYAAVRATQKGIVKTIASRCGRKGFVFFRQQERELGDGEPAWRPFLWHQIVKQQVALETKTREEACAELICEAYHLGAQVVWLDEDLATAAPPDPLVALGRVNVELGDVVRELERAAADGERSPAERGAIREQLRQLREAVETLDRAIDGGGQA